MKIVAQLALPVIAIILILTMIQVGPRQPETSSGILLLPTGTSALPAETSTPALPSETPTATPPTPPIFRDDFNRVLTPGWVWVNENPVEWSLLNFPGYLQMTLSKGIVRESNVTNMLLYPIPEGDIQVTTTLTFRPTENFQFAGLIFYESDDNHFQVGRAYCRGFGEPCINAGIYIQAYKGRHIDIPNEATPYTAISPMVLRVIRHGNEYELDLSGDGEVWIRYAKYTLDFQPTYVGLIAAGNQGEPAMALFDFFEIAAAPK